MARILDFISNSEIKLIDLLEKFGNSSESMDIAVAYVKNSGIQLTEKILSGKKVRILFSFEFLTTDPESIEKLIEVGVECKEYRASGTEEINFHPKLYIFKNSETVRIIVGSSNLTAGGLSTNVESCLAIEGSYNDEIISKTLDYFERLWNSSKAKSISKENLESYKIKKRKYEEKYKEISELIQEFKKERSYSNSVIVCMTKDHDANDIYNRLIGVPDGPNGVTRSLFFRWISKGTRIFIYYNGIGISKIVQAIDDPFRSEEIVEEWRDGFEFKGEKYPNRVKTRLIAKFNKALIFQELSNMNLKRLDTGKPLSSFHLRLSVIPISDVDGDLIEKRLKEINKNV